MKSGGYGNGFKEDKRNEYMKTLKQKLINELEEYFGIDKKRIKHAKNVLQFAEKILEKEKADLHIVMPVSILHDVGIKVGEEKYNSSSGHYQQIEGPPVARKILQKIGLKEKDIKEICNIIAYHHAPGKINTQNFKVLYDADCLENIKEIIEKKSRNQLEKIINRMFFTKSGKLLAIKLYLWQEVNMSIKSEEFLGTAMSLDKTIEYSNGSIVSKTIVEKKTGTVTLFAFDERQNLSEHIAPFDAIVFVIEGEGEIVINGEPHIVKSGQMIIMPANISHAVNAKKPFKMLQISGLCKGKSGKIYYARYLSIALAASCPWKMPLTTREAPVLASPAENTPSILVE